MTYPWPNELQSNEHEGPGREERKYHQNFIKYLKFVGDGNFDNWWGFMERDMAVLHGHSVDQEEMDHCICTHDIKQNCFIVHKTTGMSLTVGNCCIKKFLSKENYKKRCIKCKELYRGKYKNCKGCRGDIVDFYNRRVSFGKYRGKLVGVKMKDEDYVEWLCGLDYNEIRHQMMRDVHEFITFIKRIYSVKE